MSKQDLDDTTDSYPALGRALTWVDRPGSLTKIVYAFYGLCAALFAADFLYHKHSYLAVEDIPGFYAIFGLVACTVLLLCAKALRRVLKRPYDYFAPHGIDAEHLPEDQIDRGTRDA